MKIILIITIIIIIITLIQIDVLKKVSISYVINLFKLNTNITLYC